MEALRCLKRRISDAIYRQRVADAEPTTEPTAVTRDVVRRSRLTAPAMKMRAREGTRGVFTIQRGRPVHPGHRLFGPATSRTRSTANGRSGSLVMSDAQVGVRRLGDQLF